MKPRFVVSVVAGATALGWAIVFLAAIPREGPEALAQSSDDVDTSSTPTAQEAPPRPVARPVSVPAPPRRAPSDPAVTQAPGEPARGEPPAEANEPRAESATVEELAAASEPEEPGQRLSPSLGEAPELQSRWSQETPDEVWTEEIRALLDGAVTDLQLGVETRSLSCGTTLCRMELSFADAAEAARLQGMLADGRPITVDMHFDDDSLDTVVFLGRDETVEADSEPSEE